MLESQAGLQRALGHDCASTLSEAERVAAIRMNILALIVEATEALNEARGWKEWSSRPAEVTTDFSRELADILTFWLNLQLLAHPYADFETLARGITAGYFDKLAINHARAAAGYAG